MSDYELDYPLPDNVMITPLCFLYEAESHIHCVRFARVLGRGKKDKQLPV